MQRINNLTGQSGSRFLSHRSDHFRSKGGSCVWVLWGACTSRVFFLIAHLFGWAVSLSVPHFFIPSTPADHSVLIRGEWSEQIMDQQRSVAPLVKWQSITILSCTQNTHLLRLMIHLYWLLKSYMPTHKATQTSFGLRDHTLNRQKQKLSLSY